MINKQKEHKKQKNEQEHKNFIIKKGKSLQQNIKKILLEDCLQLDHGLYDKQNWPQVFNNLQKINTYQLYLDKNSNSRIISTLTTSVFSRLRLLQLHSNKITNIESLQFLNCQLLQQLSLSWNEICSLKPLQKLKWNNLNALQFNDNPITKFQGSRMKTSSKIEKLTVMVGFEQNYSIFQEDISFMAKIQAKDIQQRVLKVIVVDEVAEMQFNVLFCMGRRLGGGDSDDDDDE